MKLRIPRAPLAACALTLGVAGVTYSAAPRYTPGRDLATLPAAPALAVTATPPAPIPGVDSLFGLSGKLRVRLLSLANLPTLPFLRSFFGDSAIPQAPGIYKADAAGKPFAFITLTPFGQKVAGKIGGYRLGNWPGERRRGVKSQAYANPEGFITVTAENQDTYVSEHFRLRDFLTHDQKNVWPKALVLRESLLDKLELIVDDLQAHGVPVTRVKVLSGFRTPQYNARGAGRADLSRHMYGDAADIFIDNDGNGRMDDLNRDGKVDTRDVQVIIDAVDRVERKYPMLVGGAGRYRATRAHGPFAHVDVRGSRVRWGVGRKG